ncbi:peptide deformylase [Rhodothalassium salexigens]|uniref:peptide deformylase n=1 Tax=Rhodothalassium salexigens TaxID=1086 RepID=UPI001911E831|nr:peptide deformylase [Rhodothalassium salexigens]MBK5909967.1 peptide deformylase [Rhodothalassium salexigens]
MASLDIITVPNDKLRETSEPVERVDDELNRLIDDMLATMYEAPGIGLAAIQVAVPRRLFVCDVSGEGEERAPQVFINPELLWADDARSVYNEGCLSIPGHYAEVERPARVKVRYMDRSGAPCEVAADDLLATVIQHEMDHLDGTLFIDHLSRLKRSMIVKKIKKAQRDQAVEVL